MEEIYTKEEEIEVIKSIYNEEIKILSETEYEISIKINESLTPLIFSFELPKNYPLEIPLFQFKNDEWLKEEHVKILKSKLTQIFEKKNVIYNWIEFISNANEILELERTKNELENLKKINNYSQFKENKEEKNEESKQTNQKIEKSVIEYKFVHSEPFKLKKSFNLFYNKVNSSRIWQRLNPLRI
jgi:hypothetical protein